jgi:UDP-N-acetylmuramoyl-tripeptide--D-alanyl-D-alanine ligase
MSVKWSEKFLMRWTRIRVNKSMLSISLGEVLKATGGKLLSGKVDSAVSGVSTDSRKIKTGQLFIPLAGDRFDGHDYLEASLDAGALAALTSRDTPPFEGKTIIKVQDTGKAFRDLAAFYRGKFRIPVVGITGSVGKTSTKDMVAYALGSRFEVLKTEGNLNNEIGVPLSVFKLESFHEVAVFELGMSGLGEISRLTAIVQPDIAIITNIGYSHIEKLNSRQNILKAKLEILEGLRNGGLCLLNADDSLLDGARGFIKHRTITYGLEESADYQAYNITTNGENGVNFEITLNNREYTVHVPAPGIHNVHNALAAIAVGIELGMGMEDIIKGIQSFQTGNMRMNIISSNGYKVINDTYNASPQSMEAAMDVLTEIGGEGRSFAVLGDMLELGDWAKKAHTDVGKFAAGKGIDVIATVGMNAGYIAEGALEAGFPQESINSFDNNEDAADFIAGMVKEGDTVLVKGSRGMHMESIVKRLTI